MHSLKISLPDYLYKKLTQHAKTLETSVEEFVLFSLRRDEAKSAAEALLRRRAGRCLTVREPLLEETANPPIWVVPIFTNVAPSVKVGEIIVAVDTGKVLSTEKDVVDMIRKGYSSFGFESFALEKQTRLAELLALNGEKHLAAEEQQEMEALLAEEQALQLQNLERLEKRILS